MSAVSGTSALPPLVCLMGPTASGKTDLAMYLYDQFPCELVSVDSVLVYRGMDIGSAKPDAQTLQRYPHHLIDMLDPAEPYSAARFRDDALALIEDITARGRVPLLVGGTMLYFKALSEGLAQMPAADQQVRTELETQARTEGLAALHRQLAEVDPESAARIHPNDPQRISRAYEVFLGSGITLTQWHERQHAEKAADQTPGSGVLPYTVRYLAVAPRERSVLHERIAERFSLMLQQGLISEVEAMHARGDLDVSMPSIRAVGYRQVWDYLEGRLDYEQMRERGIIATRQLAKRQFTWLRGWNEPIEWLDSLDPKRFERALKVLQTASL